MKATDYPRIVDLTGMVVNYNTNTPAWYDAVDALSLEVARVCCATPLAVQEQWAERADEGDYVSAVMWGAIGALTQATEEDRRDAAPRS